MEWRHVPEGETMARMREGISNTLEGLAPRWVSDLHKPEFPSCAGPSSMPFLALAHLHHL